ncbi:MAG: GNAT family N-acetyltransferase [Planctomycetaceae bacterium]|jgi:GNAT superfamily N-acetyltransferase|nr:GNAT family N-acetyltransferase [Planctomycetaceae bacterium]
MNKSLNLETLEESGIDAALDRRLREHLRRCFPDSPDKFQDRRVWHNVSPEYTVVLREKSGDPNIPAAVVGHVGVVIRTITTTWNWRYNVASFQGVSVAEEYRREGLAARMIQCALDEAYRRGYLYAVLFCKEEMVPFYLKLGWRLTDDSVVMRNEQDNPIRMRSNCPMYKELTMQTFPEGPVDVHTPERVGMAKTKN